MLKAYFVFTVIKITEESYVLLKFKILSPKVALQQGPFSGSYVFLIIKYLEIGATSGQAASFVCLNCLSPTTIEPDDISPIAVDIRTRKT